MDADEFLETVESEAATELDRLGSGNLLVALTEADLEPETVLDVAAAQERAAAETFDSWANDEPDESAREAFAEHATIHRRRLERVLERSGTEAPAGDDDQMYSYLATLDGTEERIGGAFGHVLVAERTYTQYVSFFVNEAEGETTDTFRSFKEDSGFAVEEWVSLLDSLDTSEDERSTARSAAVEAVRLAYEDYADALEDLGLDPKPVC